MTTTIKLTYAQTGKATLINFDMVESTYRFFDKNSNKMATRINFQNERYVIVDEELQEILKLIQENEQGQYQACDWIDTTSNIEDRMERDYDNNTGAYNSVGYSQPRYNNNNNGYRPQRRPQYNNY